MLQYMKYKSIKDIYKLIQSMDNLYIGLMLYHVIEFKATIQKFNLHCLPLLTERGNCKDFQSAIKTMTLMPSQGQYFSLKEYTNSKHCRCTSYIASTHFANLEL